MKGKRNESKSFFNKAKSKVQNPDQLGRIEIAILQSEFFHTEATEAMAVDLKDQLKNFTGQSTEADFLRQYAIVLHSLGRSDEALSEIEEYLSRNDELSQKDRNSFLLLTSQIAAPGSAKRTLALRTILGGERDADSMQIAFTLLMQNLTSQDDYKETTEFFGSLLDQDNKHPVAENMLFALIVLEQKKGNYEIAEKHALGLIEIFPGSHGIIPVITYWLV